MVLHASSHDPVQITANDIAMMATATNSSSSENPDWRSTAIFAPCTRYSRWSRQRSLPPSCQGFNGVPGSLVQTSQSTLRRIPAPPRGRTTSMDSPVAPPCGRTVSWPTPLGSNSLSLPWPEFGCRRRKFVKSVPAMPQLASRFKSTPKRKLAPCHWRAALRASRMSAITVLNRHAVW